MASGKTLQSTIEISGVLSPSLQAAIKNAVGKLEEMSKETLASAGAAEKLTAEIGTQESVLKSLQKGYADYIVSGQESSDEAQTLADKIQELSGELDDNRETLRAAEKAAKSLTDTQADTADAYTKLEREINSQQSELSALRREYANVVLEQGESSDEAQQLASRISDLSGELNQNKQKLSEAERAADAFGDSLEEAGQDAENSGEGFTIMKGAIADLVADGIEKAVEAFKELATEGDTALGMLEAKTGATSSEMAGFEDVMYEVYNANYGDSLGDVSEKLSTVIQMTDDLDNASLAKVTKNAIALEDVFGFDVTESMRAANSLMDKFGITSEEAFNLIVQGAQNGLNQNDDLLDTINEYSVQFKNAGYSADDMFNMLANGAETGTWSVDKLGDAVKEFNIRASDGTISEAIKENAKAFGMTEKEAKALGTEIEGGSVEAYQKLIDKLKEVDDDATRYQLGVAMFGTMWEDLGEETVMALMDTQGELSKTANAMEKMDSAAYDTLESSLSQLGRTIKAEVVQPIAKKLTPVLKKAVNYINANVGPAIDWLLAHLPEVGIVLGTIGAVIAAAKWTSIVGQLTKIAGAITGFVSKIGAALAGIGAPVLIVIGVIAILAAAFMNLWKNNEEFRDKVTGIWEEIKGKFEAFGQGITDRLNDLGFDFESFTEVLSAVWDGFCDLLAPVFEGVFQQISNTLSFALDYLTGLFDVFAGIFTGDWEMVWEGVKGIFGGVWDFIVNTFTNVLNMLKSIADTVLGWFGTNWETVWGNIKTFFVNVWNGITSFFSNTWNNIKTAATTAWNGITSFLSGALNGIKTTFTNIWNGITSFLSGAWEIIKDTVQVGVQFIGIILSAAFQIITLPFRFIWENCKEYVFAAWEWIKGKVSAAINAVSSVISTVMGTIRSVISTIWNAIKSVTSSVWNGIKNVISTVWNAISAKVAAVINAVKAVISTAWNAIKSVTSSAWNSVKSVISTVWNGIKAAVSAAINAVKSVVSSVWNGIKSVTSSVWNGIKSTVSNVWNGIKSGVSSALNSVKSTVSSVWNGIKSTTTSVWNAIKSAITTPINSAWSAVTGVIDKLKNAFNFSWSLPKLKMPHISVSGGKAPFGIGGKGSLPSFSIEWYKEGGIMTNPTVFGINPATGSLMAGGEAGAEAVLPLKVLWDKMEAILRRILSGQSSTGGTSDEGLTSKAGELLTLDNFSLGSLADGTNVVIYYDFSNFTWSPQIQTGGTGDDEDDLMARLRAHEAEFFDWLEEFIKMREVAQYA